MFILSIIVTLFLISSASAQLNDTWLKCPYEDQGALVVSINRFSLNICTEQGKSPCGTIGNEPWAEQQVDDITDSAVVFTKVSNTLREILINSSPTGAGCSLLTKNDLDTDIVRPRGSRTILKQKVDNGIDISPISNRVLFKLQDRVNNTQTALTFTEKFYRLVNEFVISKAWALGTFPDSTQLIDDFNRANENPMGGNWTQFDTDGGTGNLQITSNQVARTTASGAAYYNVQTCPADCDVYFTVAIVGTSRVFVRMNDLGNNGDGYAARGISTGNTNVYRYDNGTGTQLGATCTQTVSANDELGVRAEGTNITSYLNNTAICTRSDATYSAAGFAAMQTSNSGDRLDDFFMTVVSTRRRGHVVN